LSKKPFHERVAEDLIRQLREGTAPWQRPWDIEQADIILKGSGANINHDGKGRAFYRESTDSIHLPKKGRFDAPDKFIFRLFNF
jgi:antirestriction protein ArdC